MTARFHQLVVVFFLTAGFLIMLPRPTPSQPPEKKANPTAADIAKEWRYPGVGVDYSLTNSKAFYIEKYTTKANFAEIWNYFAAKSGSKERFKENKVWAVMDELQGPDKGYSMVFSLGGGATHFGQNTQTKTVHVEIRPSGDKNTEITVVVGLR